LAQILAKTVSDIDGKLVFDNPKAELDVLVTNLARDHWPFRLVKTTSDENAGEDVEHTYCLVRYPKVATKIANTFARHQLEFMPPDFSSVRIEWPTYADTQQRLELYETDEDTQQIVDAFRNPAIPQEFEEYAQKGVLELERAGVDVRSFMKEHQQAAWDVLKQEREQYLSQIFTIPSNVFARARPCPYNDDWPPRLCGFIIPKWNRFAEDFLAKALEALNCETEMRARLPLESEFERHMSIILREYDVLVAGIQLWKIDENYYLIELCRMERSNFLLPLAYRIMKDTLKHKLLNL
jgi:hypothetical protein